MAKSNVATLQTDSAAGAKRAYDEQKFQDNLAKLAETYRQTDPNSGFFKNPVSKQEQMAAKAAYEASQTPTQVVETTTPTASSFDTSSLNSIYQSMLSDLQAQENARQKALEDRRNSALSALRDAYNQNVSGLQADSEDAKRQAYISYMLGKKGINQTLANQGINGGAAESVLANLYNTYGSNRAGIDKNYADALNDLSAQYNSGVASIGSNYLDNYANLLSSQYQSMANAKQNYANDLVSLMKSNMAKQTTNTADNSAEQALNTTSNTGKNLGDEENNVIDTTTNVNYLNKINQATADTIKNRLKQIYGTSTYSDDYNDSMALSYLQQMATQYGLSQEELAKLASEAGY